MRLTRWRRACEIEVQFCAILCNEKTQGFQGWEAILLENCRRFAANRPLLNVVDKEKWY